MKPFPQRPTLADVAAEARVSTVTVSRVIEGSAKVADSTRERVHAAMERIGYFGNAAASHLVSGRASTIGIVTSNTADFGYAATIHGIEKGAREVGMSVLICVIEGDDEASIRKVVSTVASQALGGVVVVDYDAGAQAALPALPAYLPVVSATTQSSGSGVDRPYSLIDEYEGATLAAQHLIELGHRSIFILAPHDSRPSERRSLGILDALSAARLPHYPIIRCADWQPSSGYDATKRLLDDYGDQVTAIACANDEVALGAIRAILDRGLRVPEDVSVMGFDDHPLAAFASPPLTTIRQDFEKVGAQAFSLLASLIDRRDPLEERRAHPELVVRLSTAPPRAAGSR